MFITNHQSPTASSLEDDSARGCSTHDRSLSGTQSTRGFMICRPDRNVRCKVNENKVTEDKTLTRSAVHLKREEGERCNKQTHALVLFRTVAQRIWTRNAYDLPVAGVAPHLCPCGLIAALAA